MKKTLIVAAALAVTSVSSFAQGYITWAGSLHDIVNNYTTPGTTAYNSGIDAALLFYTGAAPVFTSSGSTSTATPVASSAWASLVNGAIVVDGAPSLSSTPAVAADAAGGSFSYNAGSAWQALNVVAGTAYNAVEVTWSTAGGTYTTLAAAEAANLTLGWSAAFVYTPSASSTSVEALNSTLSGLNYVDNVASVPEPTTMVLAGLGGLRDGKRTKNENKIA